MAFELVTINKLRAHEEVSPERVMEVMRQIKKKGRIINPVVVDKNTMVILDGHHRVEACRRLGLKMVPVRLVDYMDEKIKVRLRREEMIERCIKLAVITMGLSSKVFPEKTTKHFI